MSVTITSKPQVSVVVTVNPASITIQPQNVTVTVEAKRLSADNSGTLTADGTEQTLREYTQVARIVGYVDLGNMQAGDTVVIRQYMKVKSGGAYQKYADETFTGAQDPPILYIKPKESDYGIKITLQQTVGAMRQFDYNFLREE